MEKKLNYKKLGNIFGLFIFISAMLITMLLVRKNNIKYSSMLSRYSYNNNKTNYTIYIKERDSLVPYLVIDSNYKNGILLLRKDLISRKLSFNYSKPNEYFEGTLIDEFLNNEFIDRFDIETLSKIKPIDISENKKTPVERKAFILEMNSIDYEFGKQLNEKPLKYFIFNSEDKCPISNCNGEYFVFSRTIISDNTGLKVLAVRNDDTMVSLGQTAEGFIRPALVFEKDTKIKLIKDEEFGNILVLDFD